MGSISPNSTSQSIIASSTNTLSLNITVLTGTSRALFLLAGFLENANLQIGILTAAVNGAAATFVRLDQSTGGGSDPRSEIWYSLTPPTGTVSATLTYNGVNILSKLSMICLNDVNQVSAISSHTGVVNAAGGTSATATELAIDDQVWLISTIANKNDGNGITVTAGQNVIAMSATGALSGTAAFGSSYVGPKSGAVSTEFKWNGTALDDYVFSVVAIKPSIVAGTALSTSLSDSLTLTESRSMNTLKILNQSIALSETNVKDYLKPISQSMVLTEAQELKRILDLSQSFILTESLYKDYLKAISESLVLSESKTFDYIKILNQSINLTESKALNFLKVLNDIVNLSEFKTNELLKAINQSIVLSETSIKDFSKILSDNLSITEAQSKNFLKSLTQLMTISESQNLSFAVVLGALLTFLLRGQIDTHDKISMRTDLTFTGINKMDNDIERNQLVSTGVLKNDIDEFEKDTDRITWDFHNS